MDYAMIAIGMAVGIVITSLAFRIVPKTNATNTSIEVSKLFTPDEIRNAFEMVDYIIAKCYDVMQSKRFRAASLIMGILQRIGQKMTAPLGN